MAKAKTRTNVIESKPLKSGFWNIQPINGTNSDVNLIIGQRSNGKTYGVLRYFLQQNKKTGRRFVYIRRWHDDVKATQVLGCCVFILIHFYAYFDFLFDFFCDLLVIQQRVVQPPYVGIFNSFSPVIEI